MATPFSGSLGLFVCCDGPSKISGSLPLCLFSTSQSGVIGTLPLTVPNVGVPSGVLPLFAQGASKDTASGSLPLSVLSGPQQISASLFALAWNSTSGVQGWVSLYASGDGATPGALPLSSSLPLYLERPTAGALPIFVAAPGNPLSGQLPLFAIGQGLVSGSLPLTVPVVHGQASGQLPLFTRGF